jgi:hypothetical protein
MFSEDYTMRGVIVIQNFEISAHISEPVDLINHMFSHINLGNYPNTLYAPDYIKKIMYEQLAADSGRGIGTAMVTLLKNKIMIQVFCHITVLLCRI